jgi:two-component system LytT family response regulator
MIRTIIVDDDVLHLQALVGLLKEHFKHIEVLATSNSVIDAVKKINEFKPQLIFLDIEMSPYTGFDLLEMINERNFEVIFTTNYNKYAVQAIKASALDFIEKPLDVESLSGALKRYNEKSGKLRIQNLLSNFKLNSEEQKIALADKRGLHFYELRNVVRCQSDNSYTEFHILGESSKIGETIKIVVSMGMNDFEDFLLEKGFFYRVHNQHLINTNHIRKYVKDNGGYLIMDDNSGKSIPIARARKEDFLNYLKSRRIVF